MMSFQKGLTLIELIITLSIIALLALITIPSFSSLIQNYRFKSALLQLENDLRFAKFTATQKRARIAMCISLDHLACITEPSNAWQQGWMIFIDDDNNFMPKPQNILRYRLPLHPSITIHSSQNIQHGIQFNAGKKYGKSLGTNLTTGNFIICDTQKNARKFILNIYGRLRKEDIRYQSCAGNDFPL